MATGTSYRIRGALPPQASGFVGRTAELATARRLLRESRLVTITGLGGVGKTRILRGDFDRAWPPARRSMEMQSELRAELGIAFGLGTSWLFRASAPLWERSGRWYTGAPAFEALHRVADRMARNGLGEDRFWELHAAGAAVPIDHAIERALGDDDQLGAPASPGPIA